jgi:hypothetical protein
VEDSKPAAVVFSPSKHVDAPVLPMASIAATNGPVSTMASTVASLFPAHAHAPGSAASTTTVAQGTKLVSTRSSFFLSGPHAYFC